MKWKRPPLGIEHRPCNCKAWFFPLIYSYTRVWSPELLLELLTKVPVFLLNATCTFIMPDSTRVWWMFMLHSEGMLAPQSITPVGVLEIMFLYIRRPVETMLLCNCKVCVRSPREILFISFISGEVDCYYVNYSSSY